MEALFAFSLGTITLVIPSMLALSYFNQRKLFELLGWWGSTNSMVIIYILFFAK